MNDVLATVIDLAAVVATRSINRRRAAEMLDELADRDPHLFRHVCLACIDSLAHGNVEVVADALDLDTYVAAAMFGDQAR